MSKIVEKTGKKMFRNVWKGVVSFQSERGIPQVGIALCAFVSVSYWWAVAPRLAGSPQFHAPYSGIQAQQSIFSFHAKPQLSSVP